MILQKLLRVANPIFDLKNALIDFVLPPHCIICSRYLTPEEKIVCDTCWENLEILPSFFCPDCQNFLDERSFSCGICTHNVTLSAVRSLGTFDDFYQKLIHGFKYQQKISLGQRLGRRLGEMLIKDKTVSRFDCLIPVPLHSARKRERGFNQSEILAEELSKFTELPLLKTLKRIRNTKDQTKLTPEQRIENVTGAFALIDPEKIKGKRVILVDDVITTGATLRECASVLKKAGAKEIIGTTIAVAMI